MSDETDQVETKSVLDRVKQKITGTIGYLLPLIASMPPMAAWGGLMTVPFAVYLVMMLLNLTESPPIPDLMNPQVLTVTLLNLFAIAFLLWSMIHLIRNKSEGLVTSGPYRVVRHPQYFALIIFTFFMAYDSIWILQHTLGIGWLSAEQTKILWILMLGAYAIIAKVEETHLVKTFGTTWNDYKRRVGFLLPFVKSKSDIVEMLLGILVPYAILEIVLYLMA